LPSAVARSPSRHSFPLAPVLLPQPPIHLSRTHDARKLATSRPELPSSGVEHQRWVDAPRGPHPVTCSHRGVRHSPRHRLMFARAAWSCRRRRGKSILPNPRLFYSSGRTPPAASSPCPLSRARSARRAPSGQPTRLGRGISWPMACSQRGQPDVPLLARPLPGATSRWPASAARAGRLAARCHCAVCPSVVVEQTPPAEPPPPHMSSSQPARPCVPHTSLCRVSACAPSTQPLCASFVVVLCLPGALVRSSELSCTVVAVAVMRCFALSTRYSIIFVIVARAN
jgi:hypothetical protein